MESPPECPIWGFKFGHQTQTHQQRAVFDREQKLKVPGSRFEFPFEKIESCLLRAFSNEELERAWQIMVRDNDYFLSFGN